MRAVHGPFMLTKTSLASALSRPCAGLILGDAMLESRQRRQGLLPDTGRDKT
jgi:hypothetical protein